MMKEYSLANEAATMALGAALVKTLPPGATVFLQGELGAGKTTLVRGALRGLGYEGAVKSPTYTLVEPYCVGDLRIFHFDLYRLGDPEELEFMGMRDYFDGRAICFIEWPERGGGGLPQPAVRVEMFHREPAGWREVRLSATEPLKLGKLL